MKYSSKQTRLTSARVSRKSLIGISVTVTILAMGVVTALSMQGRQTQKAKIEEGKPQMAMQGNRNYVTSNATGQTIVLDRQTGQSRPLTPEEARRLAEGLKQLINQSTDELVEVHHADGSVSMDLQGHFQDVMLAKKDADGNITVACVNNLDSAAAFFEIDPALLGSNAPVSKSPSSLNPVR
jgi:hypothetical protein